MKVRIRPMRLEDAGAVCRMGKGEKMLLEGPLEHEWYTKKDLENRLKSSYKGIMLVAEADGRVVGYTSCYLHGWVYGNTTLVDKNYRRKGIALMLMKERQRRVRKTGIRYIQFIVNINNKGMLRLAKKFGFKEGYTMKLMYKRM